MFRNHVIAAAVAVICASAATAAQQTPPQQQTPTTPTTQQAAASTTLEGCVYREQDIPGRTPNVAERAGVLEDYILVSSPSATANTGTVGTSGTTPPATAESTAAAPKMFKLEHAEDNKLSAMVGKRVQVTGRVDAEAGDKTAANPQRDRSAGPDRIELPEFEVTSITEVTTGEPCPAKPASRK